jgi:pimeloyl-ACP methyl ester carboxylesterase
MHIKDIDAVIAWVKKKSRLPVWLVGISTGSFSAAYYAVHGHLPIAGVVLLGSVTSPPKGGRGVLDFGLNRIKVPVLAIAHEDDDCPGTPPEGAKEIVKASTSSPNAEAKYFTGGGDSGGNSCRPETPHTFYGIEEEVISAIAKFIRANTK